MNILPNTHLLKKLVKYSQIMKYFFYSFLIISCFHLSASELEFLKRPPLSSKCRAMLDKKDNLVAAMQKAKTLIHKADRLEKSLRYNKKSSRARIIGLKARLEIKRDQFKKKRDLHLESLIREGCPSFY